MQTFDWRNWTLFQESETKWSKLFKSRFGHRKPLRKWFLGYLQLENECSESFKKTCSSFLPIFEWLSWNLFSGKSRQSLQDYLNSKLVIRSFLENGFEATLGSKTNVLSIWKGEFLVFYNFWVTKLKPCFGKVRQIIKNSLNQNLVIGNFLKNDFEASLSSKTNSVGIWKLQIFNWRSWNHFLGKWDKMRQTI